MLRFLVIILSLFLISCESSDSAQTFEFDTEFIHKLNIPGRCIDGEKVDVFQLENCIQSVVFKADGLAEITLTDIINLGHYSIIGDTIFASFDSIDVPSIINFKILDDDSLLDDQFGHSWSEPLETADNQ